MEGVELGAGEALGAGGCGEAGREQKRGDAVQRERSDGPAQEVERGGGERDLRERNAEGELVGCGAGGRADVVELRREHLAEDAVDPGAGGVDGGDDDGDARRGLSGELGPHPAGADGDLGVLIGRVDKGEAGCGRGRFQLAEDGAGGAEGIKQGELRGCLGVEADEQKTGPRAQLTVGQCGAERLEKLGLGEVTEARAAMVEFVGPAGEGAGVGVAGEGREAVAGAVGVQALPGLGRGLGESFDRAQAGGCRVGGDDGAPEGPLLGVVEQQAGGVAFEQKRVPEAGEPGVPGEDLRRVPIGPSEGVAMAVEGVAQRARGALVGGDDGAAVLQCFEDRPGQRWGTGHTLFIRLAGEEKRVRRQAGEVSWRYGCASVSGVDAGVAGRGVADGDGHGL